MHTNRLPVFIRIIVLAVALFGHTAYAFCQEHKKGPLVVAAHNTQGTNTIALSQILSDGILLETVPSSEYTVNSMEVTFQPKGKDYWGPYIIHGPKLKDEQMNLLKKFKDQKIKTIRVFIDYIRVIGGDSQLRTMGPITFSITTE